MKKATSFSTSVFVTHGNQGDENIRSPWFCYS